jgi:hypothetical protein
MELALVKVKFIPGEGDPENVPSNSDLQDQENRILAQFPISQIDRITREAQMGFGTPTFGYVLSWLRLLRALDDCSKETNCERIYYGVVVDRFANMDAGGLASTPGRVSAGLVRGGDEFLRTVTGQEIGHNFGQQHAVFTENTEEALGSCGATAPKNTPVFPYFWTVPTNEFPGFQVVSTLGPMDQGNENIVLGWDSERNKLISPLAHFETMSYCGPEHQWPSKFTYENFQSDVERIFGGQTTQLLSASVATESESASYTLIRGSISNETDEVEFEQFASIETSSPPDQLPEGDYILQLLDQFENIIDEISFQPFTGEAIPKGPNMSDEHPDKAFMIPIPFNSNLAEVRVLKAGNILGSLAASNNPPTVKVTSPNSGETLSGDTVSITWTGKDRDRDSLTYVVQFSPNGGSTWQTIVVDHPHTSLEVNLNLLPQTSKGLIRVQASDGFLTGSDISDGVFTVPNSSPTVTIHDLFGNQVFSGDQTVILQATSNDVEDGSLADSGYSWKSDRDGVLGTGKELIVPAVDLTEGTHIITLTGTDSGGATATDTVRIIVVGAEFPDVLITEISVDKKILGPPNHRMVPVNVEASAVALPPIGEPTCNIVSVSSNELVIGKGAGKTSPDWEITGPLSVDLRAERSGTGTGRDYTIMVECSATDTEAVSTATENVVVKVPHN